MLYAVQKGAPLVAQVIGVGALSLHLENYSWFWATMFGTQIVGESGLCFQLCYENDQFTKTGSGQRQGNLTRKTVLIGDLHRALPLPA